MTASVTGSLAVVITILSSRDPNVKNNYLMLNLALSDLLLGKKAESRKNLHKRTLGFEGKPFNYKRNVTCHFSLISAVDFVQWAWAARPP